MKGIQQLATSDEIAIAEGLPKQRASIFLESRAYLRQSLSTLLKLDPLAIPLRANPGEPPQIPSNMGNISMSHCRDALIVIWYSQKIGIDIERSDRNFNFESLAKKYFTKNEEASKIKLKKQAVLNQWSAIEAAIKWDKGKLAHDINEWQLEVNTNTLFHKTKKLRIKLNQFQFYEWTISIACEYDRNLFFSNIICMNI